MFGSLLKATVGLVVETPIALVKDVITLGGSLEDEDVPYTLQSLNKVVDNIFKAIE